MPQHFQQADIRFENVMKYYMMQAFPFYWGVVNLKVDEALLTAGTFRPLELEVIMPDGLLVTNVPETTPPLQVDLIPFKEELETTPLYVYLCVPELHETDSIASGETLSRYHSVLSSHVLDLNTGEQPVDIPRLTPNLSLQLGVEPPPHYVTLPIAEVTYDSRSFALTSYSPPQPQVTLYSPLGTLCNQLAQRLREKLGYLQQKVQSVQQLVSKDPFFEQIEGIRLKFISGLLPFEALLSSGKSSPFNIYTALCGLAAQISGVKYGEIPPRFDGYDHLNINNSYTQVINYINTVLNEVQESYTAIPFTLDDRIFTLQLQTNWITDRLILGARVQPGMTTEDITHWIKNCVIVTEKYISLAKDNRVLGANRILVDEVPSMNLVPTKGMQLFSVDVDPKYIDPKGVLCIFNVSDNELSRPLEVLLYNSNEQNLMMNS